MADTKVQEQVKTEVPNVGTANAENIKLTFEFSPEANNAMFEIFAASQGDKLKKASATRVKTLFGLFLREVMLKGITAKRNSAIVAVYNRQCKDIDDLVDSGMSRKDAEQEVFEMTGTQKRRQIAILKSSRLF